MVIIECLGLPPIEHGLGLLRRHIHERSHVMSVVWRNQTVNVAQLHHRADFLVFSNGLAAQVPLLLRHVSRLDLHAQTAAHGHIDAVFQGCGAEYGMVRSRADVRSHRYRREEV